MKRRATLTTARRLAGFTAVAAIAMGTAVCRGQDQERPKPTWANAAYGPHERNVVDFYAAPSDTPTPVLVYFHGGGFRHGDKGGFSRLLYKLCMEAGISFAAANYRYSQQAPYPAQMHDAARAIQFLRSKAETWNIDATRMAAFGGSAGAGISLWLALHDDLADPDSPDPVARQSTRLRCAIGLQAQSTYDPREIRKVVPGDAYDESALKQLFGLPQDWNWDTAEVDEALAAKLRDASPIEHLTKDDPPVMVYHRKEQETPGNIHHANFGRYLKEKMDAMGVECVRRMSTDYEKPEDQTKDLFKFVSSHFGMSGAEESAAGAGAPSAEFVYKRVGDRELKIFMNYPADWKKSDRRPAIVYFFGGGWTGGTVGQFEPQAQYFSARGMVCARADYRVRSRDDVTPADCVEDALSAMRWVRSRAADLGIDPNRIASAGGSAGGHLAACVFFTWGIRAATDDPAVSPRPNAMILYNPALDLLVFKGTERGARHTTGLDDDTLLRISPLRHVRKNMPPTLVLDGTKDFLYDQNHSLVEKGTQAGAPIEVYWAEGAQHGFFNNSPWLERTTERVDQFLQSIGYLGAEPEVPLPTKPPKKKRQQDS